MVATVKLNSQYLWLLTIGFSVQSATGFLFVRSPPLLKKERNFGFNGFVADFRYPFRLYRPGAGARLSAHGLKPARHARGIAVKATVAYLSAAGYRVPGGPEDPRDFGGDHPAGASGSP